MVSNVSVVMLLQLNYEFCMHIFSISSVCVIFYIYIYFAKYHTFSFMFKGDL